MSFHVHWMCVCWAGSEILQVSPSRFTDHVTGSIPPTPCCDIVIHNALTIPACLVSHAFPSYGGMLSDCVHRGKGFGQLQGNWGNALMAYGTLKKRYLSALQEGPQPYSYEEQDATSLAEEQITGVFRGAALALTAGQVLKLHHSSCNG